MMSRPASQPIRLSSLRYLVLIMAAALVLATACDDQEIVRVENQSNVEVVVYEDQTPVGTVEPNDSLEAGILPFNGTIVYQVRTPDGLVIEEKAFTWDDISDADGYEIVISDDDFPR